MRAAADAERFEEAAHHRDAMRVVQALGARQQKMATAELGDRDVAAMPGDIRHQGYSPKRSMLLVWENGSPEIPELIRTGKASVYPVDF